MKSALKLLSTLMGGIPEKFTPEWLEKAWAEAEAKKCNGCTVLFELHWITEHAEACVAWMRKNGVTEARYIGPFRPNPFKRGQTTMLPKGCKIRHRGEDRITKRAQRVLIRITDEGYTYYDHGFVVRNPTITWAGSSGYWTDLDLAENPNLIPNETT